MPVIFIRRQARWKSAARCFSSIAARRGNSSPCPGKSRSTSARAFPNRIICAVPVLARKKLTTWLFQSMSSAFRCATSLCDPPMCQQHHRKARISGFPFTTENQFMFLACNRPLFLVMNRRPLAFGKHRPGAAIPCPLRNYEITEDNCSLTVSLVPTLAESARPAFQSVANPELNQTPFP